MEIFYKLKKIDFKSSELISSFQNLPLDRYTKENYDYRKRRYSLGQLNYNRTVNWLNNNVFFQSIETNLYNGNLNRNFESLEDNVLQEIEKHILPNILVELPKFEYQIGIHQIRVFCNNNNLGLPAPEGIHQDGFQFIAICCIASKNINGGVTQIFDQDKITIAYEKILTPNDLFIFNDKIFYHFTTPFHSVDFNFEAYRDVFVFTFK